MSGRPFLYLSLPGVAFIIGMYWYHRRNKRIRNESGGGGGSNKSKTATATTATYNTSNTQKTIADNCNENKYKQQNGVVTNGNIANNKPSSSMSINNGSIGHHKHGQPDIEDDISASMKQFGKSAPINIIPNGGSGSAINRISPVLLIQQQNQVDSEVLKSKIQDVEHKILRSIDEDFENLSSPVDLPDSVHNNRISFYTNTRHVNIKRDEPVVIKATTTPKISPENSFLESKYVTSASNDNDLPPCASNIISATTRALSKSPPNNNNSDIAIDLPAIDENKIEVQQKQEQQAQSLKQEQQQQQVELKEKNEQIIIEQPQQEQQHQTQIQATNITEIAENVIDNIKSDETITTTTTTTTNVVNDDKRKVDTASPSLSLCSEQSGDSGKGSSLPRSEAARAKTTYEFLLPTILIGHLYGRNRSFINQVKSVSGANVMLLPESHNQPMQKKVVRICVVEGTESEINSALSMIRQRLPLKRYPNFTMQRIQYAQPQTIVPLSTESLLNLQLNLIEGINNDVQVSVVLSGNHLFVQQPLHPTHPSLPLLQKGLYDSYTNCETPLLPNIEISAVCVTCISGVWYRVQIVSADPEDEYRCVVRFLDFGGYMNVHFNDLRQIRSDFMSLPFQATECVLSNIEPIGECWTPEAADILCKLTKGIVLQAQVAGYNSLNIPEIYLFASLGPNNVIFINKEIVARNLAKWVEMRN